MLRVFVPFEIEKKFNNYKLKREVDERGDSVHGPIIFMLTGFRDCVSSRSNWIDLVRPCVSRVMGMSLPQFGKQMIFNGYDQSYFTLHMGVHFCELLAQDFYQIIRDEPHRKLIIFAHSAGVSFALKAFTYLDRQEMESIRLIGISPAFFVDHNVPDFIRRLAPIAGRCPVRINMPFTPEGITASVEAQKLIGADAQIYKGDPYLPTLYTIKVLGHEAWEIVVERQGRIDGLQVPMSFYIGSADSISPIPSTFRNFMEGEVKFYVVSGLHDPTLQEHDDLQATINHILRTKIKQYAY